MSKQYLIDIVTTEKSKKIVYAEENDELTKEEATEILKYSFAKPLSKENIKPINSPEIKAIKH